MSILFRSAMQAPAAAPSASGLAPDTGGEPAGTSRRDADAPLLFANLTNGVLQSQLRDMRAAGVSATREPLVLLCDVAELTDGATYYVAPPGDMGEAESLKQQARGALGAKRPLRGVGASDAALAYTALLS